jgi:hypothetical protein
MAVSKQPLCMFGESTREVFFTHFDNVNRRIAKLRARARELGITLP